MTSRSWHISRRHRSNVGLPLRCQDVIETVESLRLAAVHVEPEVTYEVLLVKQTPVGTEEAVLGQVQLAGPHAHVEGLALEGGVGVVTSLYTTLATRDMLERVRRNKNL